MTTRDKIFHPDFKTQKLKQRGEHVEFLVSALSVGRNRMAWAAVGAGAYDLSGKRHNKTINEDPSCLFWIFRNHKKVSYICLIGSDVNTDCFIRVNRIR
jgi:hypothetical protein